MDQREFNARLDRKYDILAEEAAAKTLAARTDAASLPQYRADLGYQARGAGEHSFAAARTEDATRFMNPDWLRGAYRQLTETGQLPANLPTPGAGAPGARAAVSPTSADVASQPSSILTSATPVEDMSPEQLAQETASQAQQGAQGATAGSALPSGPAAQRRLADAQARQGQPLPSLLRPTTVPTSKTSAVSPLYSTGFRRGTANVKPQGFKKGTTDVKPDEPTPLLGVLPSNALTPVPGAAAPGAAAPGAVPSPAPAASPSPSPTPMPMSRPESAPAPAPMGSPSPAPAPTQTAGPNAVLAGPGVGTPWNPNAMTGVDNLGGIVDATLRMVNPEKFNEALKSFRPSENIEDRRGEAPYQGSGPTTPAGMLDRLSNIGSQIVGGGQKLASDIGDLLGVGAGPAAPGSLAAQAGYNDLPQTPTTVGGILSGFHNPFSAAQPAAPMQAAPLSAAPLPASSSVVAPTESAAPAAPAQSPDNASESQGLKKGSANVKAKAKAKGKGGKASKSGGPPQGLEALLPSLLAAMQQGGGAPGPAGPPVGPPAGGPPAPGFKKGSANVKGKASKGTSGDQPSGLEALLAALQQGGGAAGPQAAGPLPMPMAPAAAAPPGFALGIGDVQFVPPPVAPLMPMATSRFAQGTPSVDPHPGYPFGAGYLFGANEVPGQGTGRTDTVPAMLAPHEAVLNKAAADMLGRGLIAALNSRGVQQMGMRRGAT